MLYLKRELFKFICPNLAYRPEQALQSVKQCYVDSNGNKARLTMSQYVTC